MNDKVKDSSVPPGLLPNIVNQSCLVNLLNQGLDADAASQHVLKESKSCISPSVKLLLLERDIIPNVKTDTVAVSGTGCKVVADPLSGVEKVVLNLLSEGVVQRSVIKFAPRYNGLVHIVYGVTKCCETWLKVLEIVFCLKSTQK